MSRHPWMPKPKREAGKCLTYRCKGEVKARNTGRCPACNKRIRDRMAKQAQRARQRVKSEAARHVRRKAVWAEEAALDAMVAAPLRQVRVHAADEAALAVASNEMVGMADGAAGFWYKWLNNPDNLCDKEALDRAGWGVALEDTGQLDGITDRG